MSIGEQIESGMHGLILRSRWIRWANRWRCTHRRTRRNREHLLMLSARLSEWAPTWAEQQDFNEEMVG